MRDHAAAQPVSIWPLGQAGFRIAVGTTVVYIDLYLSNHCEAALPRPFDHRRALRAPLDPAEITDATLILCTHDHLDHLDRPTMRTLRDASPQSIAAAPAGALSTLRALDWPPQRLIGTVDGTTFSVAGVQIECIAVAHDEYERDVAASVFQGYVLRLGDITVAHVGDARLTDELIKTVRAHRPDVLLAPINGRSIERKAMGFAGNMNAEEAVELSARVDAGLLVPMHCDMFPQNTDEDAVGRAEDAAEWWNVDLARVTVGEPIELGRLRQ